MPSYGVNMGDELANRIEQPLAYGDSRSERIRDLLVVGLAVEDALEEQGKLHEMYSSEQIADFAAEAIEEKIEREE